MSNSTLVAFGAGISFLVLAASYVIMRGQVLLVRVPLVRTLRKPVAQAQTQFSAFEKHG